MTFMRRPRWARALVVSAACAWSLTGLLAAYGYAHRYAIYRGFAAPATPAGVAQGSLRVVSFRSPAIGARSRYMIYLPAGYAEQSARGRRYPVLYLLHGYPGKMPVFVNVGAVHVAANVAIARRRMKPMILVMPAGKSGTLGADTEWADTPSGRWMSNVMDVVHDVDHRFATIPDRQHRGIAGDSLGGYAALNVGLHHLPSFSVIQSWGGYFRQTPTGVFAGASPAALRDNSPAEYIGGLAPEIRRLGLRTWVFQGRTDDADPRLLRAFAAQLHAAGADVHLGFFPGGHDWGLFRAQAPRMLIAASRWFAEPPRGRNGFASLGRSLSPAQLARIKEKRRAHRAARHRARR